MSTYHEIISERRFHDVSYVTVFFASTFMLFRCGLQMWKRKYMKPQDWLVYFEFVGFLAMSICYLVIAPRIYQIGRLAIGLEQPWPTMSSDVIIYVRMMFVTTTLFWTALWFVKLSLLVLYKKLMEGLPKIYKLLWWATCGFCLVVGVSSPLSVSC